MMKRLLIWILLGLLGLICLSPLLWTAPVPKPKSFVAPIIEPGDYEVEWNTTKCVYHFYKDGTHYCPWGADKFHGSWIWDAKTRTLHIHESKNGSDWNTGVFPMGEMDLKTTGEYGQMKLKISLTFIRKKPNR
jgi:hypothetical protein